MSRTLAAAVLLLATACGGGGDRVTQGDGTPSARPASSSPAMEPVSPTPSPTTVRKHGSAKVRLRGQTYTWAERGCETTYGLDGRPAGYLATFQDVDEQAEPYVVGVTGSRSYVQLRVRGGYAGDGTYPAARLALRVGDARGEAAVAHGFGAAGQRLVLRDGGKKGTYTGGGVSLEFTCDPADETAATPRDPVAEEPAPGTAYVVRPEGAFAFDGVRCGRQGGDVSVVAGSFPRFFRVLTDSPSGGGARVLLALHGVVTALDPGDTRAALTGDPVRSGTFTYDPLRPASATRGAFTC
jgi:hypothetical protein